MHNVSRHLLCLLFLIMPPALAETAYFDLVDSLNKVREENNISASIVIISTADTTLLLKTLGTISQRHNGLSAPFTSEHYLRLGSISKLFTGLSILALEQKTNASIDALKIDALKTDAFKINRPIREYLDKVPFKNEWAKQYPVTTAMLLEHTAGLGGMTPKEFSFNQPVSIGDAFQVDPDSRKLKWPPGFHSAYSNTGAGVAAHVIEKVSRTTFEDFVEEAVFRPMGLDSASYELTAAVKKKLITGYNTDGMTPIPYWHTLYRAFGGINIKGGEMHRVLKMFLGKGKIEGEEIFSESMITRMETPGTSLAAQSGLEYGYGLGLYHFDVEGIPFMGHGGDADGYLAYFAYSRHLNLGYFVLINAFNHKALNKMKDLIQTDLIRGSQPPHSPSVYTLSKTRISEIIGSYQSTTSRFTKRSVEPLLTILVDADVQGDRIYTLYQGQKRILLPVNAFHFRRQNENRATIAIVEKAGDMFLQGDIGNFKKQNKP